MIQHPASPRRRPRRLALTRYAVLLALSTVAARAAYTWHDFQFGGFASQGYLKSSANDYLGDTSRGTFDFREYGLNGSWSRGQWRVGAQVFGQRLGDYGDDKLKLDWAMVDYQPAQAFGLRVGRVKLPHGLYNESLDLDAVRPFVLLPQSVYDNRLRDFIAAFNGGMAYGNIGLKAAGSIDYKVYYGKMPLSTDSGASDYFNTDAPFPNLQIGLDSAVGSWVFWNTPLQGLRVGYSFSRFKNFRTLRYIPFRGVSTYKTAPEYDRHLISAEYTCGDWVFAAEAGRHDNHYDNTYLDGTPYAHLYPTTNFYYVSAAWRAKSWLELGSYYSHYHFDQWGVGTPVVFPVLNQGDYALSARFDVNEHLLFKVEGHYMDGAGAIFDIPSHPQPVTNRDNSWTMFAAKVTVLF
jgi:hypothetical protein